MPGVYRRFVSDLTQETLVPIVEWPELAALEAERRRLVDALNETYRAAPRFVRDEDYIAAKTRALREGTEPPEPPPTPAEQQAEHERHRRDVEAVERALLRVGDEICAAIANHPEWEATLLRRAQHAQEEATALRQQAVEAERRAHDISVMASWLHHAGDGELYIPTFTNPADVVEVDTDDPVVAGLITTSRSGVGL